MKQAVMPPTLRKELLEYLSQLESQIFSEDTQYLDKKLSLLIDCVLVLLEEGEDG